MNPERRSLQIGAVAIACALVFRFLSGGVWDKLLLALQKPEVASTILFFSTGRMVQPVLSLEEVTTPTQPDAPEAPLPVFSAEDAALVQVKNTSDCEIDVAALLQQPLTWNLTGDDPAVLILHTHGTESYAETEGFRTEDTAKNMISIGDSLAARLEAAGIGVIHDRTAHDAISYNGSYSQSRQSVSHYLAQYPSIRLVLDIHRDAMEDDSGNQIATTVSVDGRESAQLMLVLGTDSGGYIHPNWQENLSLAVKLQTTLEKSYPGICRPLNLRSQRFNQDLSPGALLVEVGAAGNTHQQALVAAEVLAEGILALAKGSQS